MLFTANCRTSRVLFTSENKRFVFVRLFENKVNVAQNAATLSLLISGGPRIHKATAEVSFHSCFDSVGIYLANYTCVNGTSVEIDVLHCVGDSLQLTCSPAYTARSGNKGERRESIVADWASGPFTLDNLCSLLCHSHQCFSRRA